jgi:hypothetical protein
MAALSRSAVRLIVRGRGGQQLTGCLQASQAGGHQPERLERGGLCRLLKLRLMGANGVHMKGVLLWFVRTRYFGSVLAALVSQEQFFFFTAHYFNSFVPIVGQAVVPRRLSLNMRYD